MKLFAPILLFVALSLLTGCPDSTPAATDTAASTEAEANAGASADVDAQAAAEAEAAMPDAVTDPDAPIPPPPEPSDGGVVSPPPPPPPPSSHSSIAVGEPNPGAPGVVDQSCNTDADCAIKDVGSCCGYAPACVNTASPTFPEQVQAKCAKDGRMGICGFPAITGCKCTAGKCEGTGADAGSRVQ